MRGSLRHNDEHARQSGIIPAHAGLTGPHTLASTLGRDHPRACGAHLMTVFLAISSKGSSPRMRGSLTLDVAERPLIGIIPAHAGLTTSRMCPDFTRRDHPRACGAHPSVLIDRACPSGSSPRMRGSPTCRPERAARPWDHPRACGAHVDNDQQGNSSQGSSPRMRGSHHR